MKKIMFSVFLSVLIIMLFSLTIVGQTTTIRFQDWRLAEEPAGPCLEEIVRDFEDEYPNINVDLDAVSVNDKIDKFVTQTRGGNPPDVVRILTTDVPGFVDMGLLNPLDNLVKASGGQELTNKYNQFLINAMTINN